MKELLSIEQKAKAYDEAIEGIRKILSSGQDSIKMSRLQLCLQGIFPELKESEDERIRNEIILYIGAKDDISLDIHNKWLSWLEKQGEENFIDKNLVKEEAHRIAWEYSKHYDPLLSKESWCEMAALDMAYWLEKQGYQKSADKVEPKFHEGEWVVNKLGDSWHIDGFDKKNYQVSNVKGNYNYFPIEKQDELHHWTIQDAKDGDVLQLGKVTGIFQEYIGNGNCKCYCSVCNGEFEIPSQDGADNSYGCHNAILATKEQHDLLFAKMHEAEYEWDIEKKELKKIEENKIEIPFGAKDSELQEATYYIPKGFHAEIERDKVVIKRGEQKSTEWNVEDSIRLQRIIDFLWYNRKGDTDTIYQQEEDIDWLKSLKDRVQPKQDWSEKDEKTLDSILFCIEHCRTEDTEAQYNGNRNIDLKRYEPMSNWLKSLKSRKLCVYNPYKAVVESIAKMCNKYKNRMSDEEEAKDFLANVAVKCREAAEYDKQYMEE